MEKPIDQPLRIEKIEKNRYQSNNIYLWKVFEFISSEMVERESLLFDPLRLKKGKLPEDLSRILENAIAEIKDKPNSGQIVISTVSNKRTLEFIEKEIGTHSKAGISSSFGFDKTERRRCFFRQTGVHRSGKETYCNTLFFGIQTDLVKDLVSPFLQNKNIVLFGGGRSVLEKELNENNIFPKRVINIDPFVENPEEGSDPVVCLSATDSSLSDKIKNILPEGVDEIWAEYSVPAYLTDPKEIVQLFKNIDDLLLPGGSARIWPLQVGGTDNENDDSVILREKALISGLTALSDRYEIVMYHTAGRKGLNLYKKNNI